jgi:hypothetical protein
VRAGCLPAWEKGELPAPPSGGWKTWAALVGPGVLLAGASIGTGEWLFGPAVTAQYGATLLWLGTISILCQVFCNLEMMRYTLYCGEPVMVGFFRTRPGPYFWVFVYAFLDLAAVWPYNASNAAVPLAAVILGHLPGSETILIFGLEMTERHLVKLLGFMIFFAAFVPLVFGGTVYRMLERIMLVKLVIVLVYLITVTALMVTPRSAGEVVKGFVGFGNLPLRAETVIVNGDFTYSKRLGSGVYTVKGTMSDNGLPEFLGFIEHVPGKPLRSFGRMEQVPWALRNYRDDMLMEVRQLCQNGRFLVEDFDVKQVEPTYAIAGDVTPGGDWIPASFALTPQDGERQEYAELDDVPDPRAERFRELLDNRGLVHVNAVAYMREHEGRLPDLDWTMVAGFIAIAGAGGMTNTLFSNYARDKGWGMGAKVGAIPSAVGGRNITLSHVGSVFALDDASRPKWRGWYRHIVRDQLVVWMICAFVGMALPCMLSLEFIRNVPVSGDRVAAASAQGMADRFPAQAEWLWLMTLGCGFLILAPGQIMAGDVLARRWTDIIWNTSRRARRMQGNQVKYIYYSILALYGVFGFTTLLVAEDPLFVAKFGTFFQSVGLGWTALHTLYANRTLLPKALRPNWFMQAGLLASGVFFLGVTAWVVYYMWL